MNYSSFTRTLSTMLFTVFLFSVGYSQHQVMSISLLEKAVVDLANDGEMVKTIDFRVYLHTDFTSTSTPRTLLKFNEAGSGQFLSFGNSSNDISNETLRLQVGTLQESIIITNVLTAGWHHIVITSDGSFFNKVYVDGNLSGTVQGSAPVFPLNEYTIGGPNGNFTGKIDELRFWKVTTSDIDILGFSDTEICVSEFDHLVAYNRFEDVDEMAFNELSDDDTYTYAGAFGPSLIDTDIPLDIPILGCTESNADNYDPAANCNDGSCVYTGCTHPNADNYDPQANTDDGSCFSCIEEVCFEEEEFLPGSEIMDASEQNWLMNQLGSEFHFEAELIHDEETHTQGIDIANVYETSHTLMIIENSCGQVFGGFNAGYWVEAPTGEDYYDQPYENNFLFRLSDHNILHTLDEFTVGTVLVEPYYVFPEGAFYDLGFNLDLYVNFAGPVVGEPIRSHLGHVYECPLNDQDGYETTPDDLCDFYFQEDCAENTVSKIEFYALKTSGHVPGIVQMLDTDGDGICDTEGSPGCKDPSACNYDNNATNTLSCEFLGGCLDSSAVNYSPLAQCDDSSCIYAGCTNSSDANYNPLAIYDDGTCASYGPSCPGDFNGNGTISASDLAEFLGVFGNSCE